MKMLGLRIPVGALLAFSWIIVTMFFFFGLSVAVFSNPRFPLAIGAIRTTGRAGLWITFLPAVVALAGLIAWKRKRLSAGLLAAYCAFWSVFILGGLPYVWNARQSFCFKNYCITTHWVARLAVLALATPFVLGAISRGRSILPEKRDRKALAPA
jgi:hypothetical protein